MTRFCISLCILVIDQNYFFEHSFNFKFVFFLNFIDSVSLEKRLINNGCHEKKTRNTVPQRHFISIHIAFIPMSSSIAILNFTVNSERYICDFIFQSQALKNGIIFVCLLYISRLEGFVCITFTRLYL